MANKQDLAYVGISEHPVEWLEHIWQRIRPSKGGPGTTAYEGLLERSEIFNASFATWRDSEHCREILAELHCALIDRIPAARTTDLIVMDNEKACGFAWKRPLDLTNEQFRFIFDLFKLQVKEQGYRSVLSDTLIGKDGVQRDRHYLKPPLAVTKPIDQCYGNVRIEQWSEGGEPLRIRFMCMVYQDRNYQPARPVEGLYRSLFTWPISSDR